MKNSSKNADMYSTSCVGHKVSKGIWMLVIGILILWNVYMPFMQVWALIGYILVVLGISKLVMPKCDCGHYH